MMKILTLETAGGAPSSIIQCTAKKICDFYQQNISGSNSSEMQEHAINQEFIDNNNIKALYASGTFMGFTMNDDILDAFEELPRW